MYLVYAIKSEIDGRIYVGMTQNLMRRIAEHNCGHVHSTKGFRPWVIIYIESFLTRLEARKQEKKLKSGYGKEFLKTLK